MWVPASAAFVWAVGPAHATCDQSGTTVTCSGTTTAGFGDGTQNGYTVTVQPDASMALAGGSIGFHLNNNNVVTNSGTITASDNMIGMQGGDGNTFTNNGVISILNYGGLSTGPGVGMSALGTGNSLVNNGTIVSDIFHSVGLDLPGDGNVVTNAGTITLTGSSSNGISAFSYNNIIFNSGTITVGNGSTSTNDIGVFLYSNNTFTNTGLINAVGVNSEGVDVSGDGNTIVNNGIIRGGAALAIVGQNETIVNNGTIAALSGGGSIVGLMVQSSLTNNGTIDGRLFVNDFFNTNTFTNAGLVTITDPNTPVGTGHLFQGTFRQTATGVLALRVNAAGAADTFTTTAANLGGTLRAVLQPGTYAPTTFYSSVFAATDPLNGQFDHVTTSSAFYSAVATYNSTSVDLTLTRYGFGAVPGETQNQRAVGNALESAFSSGPTGNAAIIYGNLLQASSVAVLDQLSGEGTAAAQNTAFLAGGLFHNALGQQMDAWRNGTRVGIVSDGGLGYAEEKGHPAGPIFKAALKAPVSAPSWHAWGSGFGARQSLKGDAAVGSADLGDRAVGGALGFDVLVDPTLLLGLGAGGSTSHFDVSDRATSGTLEGLHLGAYAMQSWGSAYMSGLVSYSRFDNSIKRGISGVGAAEIATGSFSSDHVGARLEIGNTWTKGAYSVTPFAAIQIAELFEKGYTENTTSSTGAPGMLGLTYQPASVISLPTSLGAEFDTKFALDNGAIWSPYLRAAWVHEFNPARKIDAVLTSIPGTAFSVDGARAASNAFNVNAGARLSLTSNAALFAAFNGEFSNAGQAYGGSGGLRLNW